MMQKAASRRLTNKSTFDGFVIRRIYHSTDLSFDGFVIRRNSLNYLKSTSWRTSSNSNREITKACDAGLTLATLLHAIRIFGCQFFCDVSVKLMLSTLKFAQKLCFKYLTCIHFYKCIYCTGASGKHYRNQIIGHWYWHHHQFDIIVNSTNLVRIDCWLNTCWWRENNYF